MKKQRTIVITGGGSGIGKAAAKTFTENGDKVFILGRDQTKLEAVSKDLNGAIPIALDITDVLQVEAAVAAVAKQVTSIDVLINSAGGVSSANAEGNLAEANAIWKFVVEVNLTGAFNIVEAFRPLVTRQSGRIILVSSLGALTGSSRPNINGQAYAAAKSGIHGLVRTLTAPLAKEGITINAVAPGVIDHTEFFGDKGIPDDRKEAAEARIPVGRLGEPAEIAAGIFYLASKEAAFVTGEILNINGGAVFGR